MSENFNPFEMQAGLGSDQSAVNPFESTFKEVSVGEDKDNPFDPPAQGSTPNLFEAPPVREVHSESAARPAQEPAEVEEPDAPSEIDEGDSSDEAPETDGDGSPDESGNPLMAAMEKQEQTTIFAKLPVFVFGSAREDIEDTKQTFEDLRVAKANDFPELEDEKRVTWDVTYGKIKKTVYGNDAKKKKIGEFKKSIETSKEFLDALKKSKDKNPMCEIKPRVTAQSKGERMPAYKGVFRNIDEAESSGKLISIVPGGDGKVYEIRNEEIGRFITPVESDKGLSEITAGFTPALPLIPSDQLMQIITFFRSFMCADGAFEAIANILWDRQDEVFITCVPKQEVTRCRAISDLSDVIDTDRYLHYMDLHSHNVMQAKFSGQDDKDEKATRLYAVIGRLDRYLPSIRVRLSNGGKFLEIDPALVFEPLRTEYPAEWDVQVVTKSSADVWNGGIAA